MKIILLPFLWFVSVYSDLVCPPEYTLVLDKCLRVLQNQLTHTQAEADCTYSGGTLVNVHSAIENRAVADFASKSGIDKTWLGLFCFSNQNSSNCYYDDNSGTDSVYDNFASGYPLIDGIYGGCVYMATSGPLAGKWISVNCEAENISFVCELPSSSYDPSCVHNYNGFCYYPSTELNTTMFKFQDAEDFCKQSHGGHLASINSKRENDYIMSVFRGIYIPSYGKIFLGAQELMPNVFSWLDGSNFANFDYRDPMDNGLMNCLAMDTWSTTGLWMRVDCTAKLYFVCKRPIDQVPTPQNELDFKTNSNPSDFSNCNSTFVMAPGIITSYGYLSTEPFTAYCTWKIVTLGAYRIRLSFTNVNTYNVISIFDEYGRNTNAVRNVQTVLSKTNMVTVQFQGSGRTGDTGFRSVAQPYSLY